MNETLPNAVLCVGMLNCDVFFRNTPKNLMHTDTSFMRDVTMLVGGDAANVSQNLAHMGITSYLAANVAGDVFGQHVCDTLEGEGVDTRFVRRDSETGTAVSLFFYDTDGKKHCGAFRGGNRSFHPDMVSDEMLKSARHMHIGSFVTLESFIGQPAETLIRRAKALGLTVSADISGGSAADRDTMRRVIPLCDVFTMNEEETLELTNETDMKCASEKLREFAPALLILKQGARGVFVTDFKGYEKQFAPLARPEEVKDAVGAGDSFISGYIAALLHGESRDECIKTGSAASAICISDFGASNWKVSYEQVRAFAAERA